MDGCCWQPCRQTPPLHCVLLSVEYLLDTKISYFKENNVKMLSVVPEPTVCTEHGAYLRWLMVAPRYQQRHPGEAWIFRWDLARQILVKSSPCCDPNCTVNAARDPQSSFSFLQVGRDGVRRSLERPLACENCATLEGPGHGTRAVV